MKPCSTCAGTLQRPLGRVRGDQDWPCEKCLSFPVNAALRTFTREWLGFSPWSTPKGFVTNGWTGGPMGPHVVPLYLPAGMDLVRDTVSRDVYREITGQKPEDIDTEGEPIDVRARSRIHTRRDGAT